MEKIISELAHCRPAGSCTAWSSDWWVVISRDAERCTWCFESAFSLRHVLSFFLGGCLGGDETLESPLHLRSKRKKHPKCQALVNIPPLLSKPMSIFVSCPVCKQLLTQSRYKPAPPVVFRAWGEGLWGSGGPAALSSGRAPVGWQGQGRPGTPRHSSY